MGRACPIHQALRLIVIKRQLHPLSNQSQREYFIYSNSTPSSRIELVCREVLLTLMKRKDEFIIGYCSSFLPLTYDLKAERRPDRRNNKMRHHRREKKELFALANTCLQYCFPCSMFVSSPSSCR